ncbi:cellulose synthase-like protein H1 [Vitis vinifera]|uniref:cellulose synthase-like protein H1 n=1 Tax=Vitis vinifera TaxID=29760 RepID=UPI00023B3432|nr:cellulose synthase-like protein H1 [Vitis vinifera]|eukprot:XP_019078913.1 PREDICTED: cellulose synthase-like protein H1 [Vitis vinifera]
MAKPISSPLHEKFPQKNTFHRALDLTIFFLLLSLLAYRLLSLKNNGFTWLLAFLCESWFTFIWILNVSTKWNPVSYKTYPERLLQCYRVDELPPVDMFVTTADPMLEPPIITVNTVLSLLAVDYPANKLSCYVSDDGASPLTFYALLEASKFAKLWVPFCKKYGIQTRAPFRYFSRELLPSHDNSTEFLQEYRKIMDEYEELRRRIEHATLKSISHELSTADFVAFSNIKKGSHPTIIKVILENKESRSDGLPHLVYVSREKDPKHPHHYKAGAMNVLTRVSGAMTNAPFMLNVDCDMYANNPQIFHHAMCLLLGSKNEQDCGFVQSPQCFYDGLKDDPFGNQLVVLYKYLGSGIAGLQGPTYIGTGCFHRRKVIYGLWPDGRMEIKGRSGMQSIYFITIFYFLVGKLTDERIQKTFGNSKEFTKTAARILSGLSGISHCPYDLLNRVEAAQEVATCSYEYGTSWGTKIGCLYGSTTEDVLTGMRIQARGWKSTDCRPDPPAFLGCAPSGGPAALTQQKRWATGLLEILFSKNSPFIAAFTAKLQFRQCLAYLWFISWALRSIPELCYLALPAYCIMAGSHFLPKVQEPAVLIPISLFVSYNFYTLFEYYGAGFSIRACWNNLRMGRITAVTAWLFGFFSVILKLLGLSETVFEVTKKDQSTTPGEGSDKDAGRFTFDGSLIFVPATTLLLVHLMALVTALLGLFDHVGIESRIGEIICSVWVVLCFSPFLKGLFGKGKYGIPTSSISKSVALALLFLACTTTVRK